MENVLRYCASSDIDVMWWMVVLRTTHFDFWLSRCKWTSCNGHFIELTRLYMDGPNGFLRSSLYGDRKCHGREQPRPGKEVFESDRRRCAPCNISLDQFYLLFPSVYLHHLHSCKGWQHQEVVRNVLKWPRMHVLSYVPWRYLRLYIRCNPWLRFVGQSLRYLFILILCRCISKWILLCV